MELISSEVVGIDFSEIFRIMSTATRVKTFVWKGRMGDTIDIPDLHRPEWPVKGIIVQVAVEKKLGSQEVYRLLLPFEELTTFDASQKESPITFGVSIEPVPAGTIEVRAVLSG
ncbi:MAG: hypothetical protein HQM09_14470 [Candidatus Riflebacteria bacterium]|nr:hypothetical protein [Candidatus Riflebacteria bacterium]